VPGALEAFEEAINLSSEDFVLERLGSLEDEIRSLKAAAGAAGRHASTDAN
jgi:hypothetical protein